jgi:hypothetical protein
MKWLSVVALGTLVCLSSAWGQTSEEKKATVAYLRGLQTKAGGFRPEKLDPAAKREAPASLRATSAAVRALKYFGGEVPDRKGAVRFVRSCFHQSSGGFSDTGPSSKPNVVTTAVGIMAVVELKMPADPFATKVVQYLDKNARSFEEIRIAAAGLESLGKKSTKAGDWLKEVQKMCHRDGTYGKGTGAARATGSAVVTVLRLGGEVAHRDQVVKTLKKGQRKDGGFGKEGATSSDLETTYRVMRAFRMLKERPADEAALRHFVTRCRNPDGGYGVAAGQRSTVSGTYFASSVLHWLAQKPARSGSR